MFIEALYFSLILGGSFLPNIGGYIDPGSGSLVIQMIIGALVGIGITLKIYWYKLKNLIFNVKNKDGWF